MERKLISSNGLLLKTIFALALSALFFYDLVTVFKHGVEKKDVITVLVLLPALGLAALWAFSAAHPVYFDRGFLYYTRYGKEYRIACEEINKVSVLSGIGNEYCELKFYNSRKKVQSIHFWLVSDGTTHYALLQQLESIIRHTKPNFEVEGLH